MEVLSEVFDTKLAKINVICMQNGIATFNQVDVVKFNQDFCSRFRSRLSWIHSPEGSSPDEVEEDDFFKALRSPGSTTTEGTNCARLSNKMGKELESWCLEKQRNKLLEQAMFPALSRAA
ncbi:hypothetical protein GWK47_041400 [Chionoecetes opilio]|uniref:Uncharacterized protein n=1 Tax=Chionoecetes opilio TaxID=41210 RepID=A0A8J4YH31_CHIOP|nr:hypothetical protein GWK47_041400 [Chionoecetes opilio]